MLKVLVIDADSNFASHLGRAIVKQGHEARIVADAKYGIVRAKAFEPDLVLVATNVPGVTITQLIEDLKPLVPGRIAVCADNEDADAEEAAKAAGAGDYLLKSAGIDAIVAKTCPSDGASDTGESGEEDQDDGSESAGPKKEAPQRTLRAPVKEGTRPFCVVVAHTDGEKRSFIAEIVERLNPAIHVIEADSSINAITACAQNRTVMLVIDWDMPEIPARQVMKSVHDSKHGKSIAMFVTYKSNSPEKQRVAMYAGALAFAHEPWGDGSLEGQLRDAMDVVRKRRRKAKIKVLKAKAS